MPPRPDKLFRFAADIDQWASEASQSTAVDTPWGAPSSELAERFAALAAGARALAGALEKSDAPAAESAWKALDDELEKLAPLASAARKRCYASASEHGRLPPAEIQRIVRTAFPAYRACYEDGLRRTPTLAGTVAIRFVIAADGALRWPQVEHADLPDPAVIGCLLTAFLPLAFPAPEGGIVTVVYPIMFSPGDSPPPKGS